MQMQIEMCDAARRGDLLEVQRHRRRGCEWHAVVCTAAARNGHLHVLAWAVEYGCPWNASVCIEAAKTGHLKTLEWARRKGCVWNSLVCVEAAERGHIHILEFARRDLPWAPCTCRFEFYDSHNVTCPWSNCVCGQDDPPRPCLHVHKKCAWNMHACVAAARSGNIETLVWLRTRRVPCPWNSLVLVEAARYGHVDILRYLRDSTMHRKRPLTSVPFISLELACSEAAKNGHLDALTWLRSQHPPCPWNAMVAVEAARHNHVHILKYIHESLTEVDDRWVSSEWVRSEAVKCGSQAILAYLKNRVAQLCPK